MADKEHTPWEQYQEFQRGAGDAYEHSVEAAAALLERYSAESFAASGSDDPAVNSYLAWLNYQRELANVAYEYWRAVGGYRRSAANLFYDEEEAATTSMYESYRDNIDQLVSDIGSRSRGASSMKSGASTRSNQGTSARRRGSRSRSSSD
jgi:hypothetical protein